MSTQPKNLRYETLQLHASYHDRGAASADLRHHQLSVPEH